MVTKDNVKFFKNETDIYTAVRCAVCDTKRMVKANEDAGCEAGCDDKKGDK